MMQSPEFLWAEGKCAICRARTPKPLVTLTFAKSGAAHRWCRMCWIYIMTHAYQAIADREAAERLGST